MKNPYVFNRLFAEPSFFEGVARVLDLGTTLQEYNVSETEQEADIEALKNDWRAVGDDLRSSIKNYEQRFAQSA
ncbi:MAG: hypothetical protein HYT47_02280 [Candidatus Vogelbacteria bacterium]|nr:hypothetical protein [Candidatus Vogelbacteria bacterium]